MSRRSARERRVRSPSRKGSPGIQACGRWCAPRTVGRWELEIVQHPDDYMDTIERALARLSAEASRFDLCLYNAGMDPFEACPIGGLRGITREVLSTREMAVFSWCRSWGIPMAFVIA